MGKKPVGHMAALLTILIWGVTFISTKVLLTVFSPVEILLYRFLLGLAALYVIYPKPLRLTERRQELWFAGAGLSGVTLYYLLENIALTYSQASNVGVIVSVSPFFTALFSWLFFKGERPRPTFFAGFIAAIAGICLLTFGGDTLQLDPRGDLLALLAAVTWAAYSVITRKITSFGYPTIPATRRAFFYGFLFMFPFAVLYGVSWDLTPLLQPAYLGNLLFLGLGACALCFVSWGFCVKVLGAVQTCIYIYLVPVVTVIASLLILKERLTPMAWAGILLTLAGLFLSEGLLPRPARLKKT